VQRVQTLFNNLWLDFKKRYKNTPEEVQMRYDYVKTKIGLRKLNNPKKYLVTYFWQCFLHFIGIAWHNSYSDECTTDFNCCNTDIGKKAWLRIVNKCCLRGNCGKCNNCKIDALTLSQKIHVHYAVKKVLYGRNSKNSRVKHAIQKKALYVNSEKG
jgi:hypothetical protein